MSYLEELLPEFRKGAKIRCSSWTEQEYIYLDNRGTVVSEKGNDYVLNIKDFKSAFWEFYQEPIDYDYIIKNKCICWFWNEEHLKYINTLSAADRDGSFVSDNFIGNDFRWKNCRPVRRYEVTFYEDRKDD